MKLEIGAENKETGTNEKSELSDESHIETATSMEVKTRSTNATEKCNSLFDVHDEIDY
jgi:hypothetical protein